jgi:hypothetical protein
MSCRWRSWFGRHLAAVRRSRYTLNVPGIRQSVAIALFGCNSAVALGQSLVDAENLLVSPPKDFKVAFVSNSGNNSMTEFVPVDQTVEDWSQMLTVQVYRHAQVDAATFLQGVGKRFANACPGTTVIGKGIQTGQVNGYVVSMLFLQCPKNPRTGKPETTVFRAIKGKDALYSVQRAWRAIPSAQDVEDVMHAMGEVTVCDTRVPEHPCPPYDPEVWHTLDKVPVCDTPAPEHPCPSIGSLVPSK